MGASIIPACILLLLTCAVMWFWLVRAGVSRIYTAILLAAYILLNVLIAALSLQLL